MLAARSAAPAGPECFRRMLYTTDPLDEAVRRQDLIVVNPPEAFGMLGSLLKWVGENEPVPRHTRVLVSSAFQPVHVYRPDATTLIVQPMWVFWRAGSIASSGASGGHLGWVTRSS